MSLLDEFNQAAVVVTVEFVDNKKTEDKIATPRSRTFHLHQVLIAVDLSALVAAQREVRDDLTKAKTFPCVLVRTFIPLS